MWKPCEIPCSMPILVGKSPHIFDLLVEASAQHDGSLHLQSCAVKPVLPATDRADAWGKAENVFIKSMGMTIYLSTCLPIYLSVCRCMYIPTTAWKSKAGSRNLEIWLLKVYIYISAYNVIMYIYNIYIYRWSFPEMGVPQIFHGSIQSHGDLRDPPS